MQSRSTNVEWDRVVSFTEEMKRRLKRPLGELRRGDVGFDEELRKTNFLVVVGDYSFARLRMSGLKPHVVVVDGRIERRDAGEPGINNYSVVRVRNPAGCITPEAAAAVVEAVKRGHGAVFVEGEEDLLALPAISALPEGGVLVYGQPGEGYVVVRGGESAWRMVKELLEAART